MMKIDEIVDKHSRDLLYIWYFTYYVLFKHFRSTLQNDAFPKKCIASSYEDINIFQKFWIVWKF